MTSRPARAFRALLDLLTRPVRGAGGGGIVVQPYRGYGSREQVFVVGRVFRQPTFGRTVPRGTLRRQLIDLGRRLLRWGVADAALIARIAGAEQRVSTDRDGYFRVRMRPAHPPSPERLWHRMGLELVEPARVEAEAELFVPPCSARYVVISDIDDTVMYTGVASKSAMLWRLFMQGAESRVAFPGVAAFLEALHCGRSGREANPMLYVSRAPWSLYEVLEAFFRRHRIPTGPILFLREWGLTLQSPLPRRDKGHKREVIDTMLSLYADLPFVLIGDSGQHDPEIYARIVREHPGRVAAIYIRNVSRAPARRLAIEALAEEVADAGSTLLLAADSTAMAEHAAGRGLIPPEALAAVREERRTQEEPAKPTRAIARPGSRATREAVQAGELHDALGHEGGDGAPRNVVVEPEDARR